jgi:hypothetical protein
MPKDIAGMLTERFDVDLFPLRMSSSPPETEEQKFNSLGCGLLAKWLLITFDQEGSDLITLCFA